MLGSSLLSINTAVSACWTSRIFRFESTGSVTQPRPCRCHDECEEAVCVWLSMYLVNRWNQEGSVITCALLLVFIPLCFVLQQFRFSEERKCLWEQQAGKTCLNVFNFLFFFWDTLTFPEYAQTSRRAAHWFLALHAFFWPCEWQPAAVFQS